MAERLIHKYAFDGKNKFAVVYTIDATVMGM